MTDASWTLALALGHTVIVSGSASWCEGCAFRDSSDEQGRWGPGDCDHRVRVVADAMIVTGELSASAATVFAHLARTFPRTLTELVSTCEAVVAG